MCGNGRGRLPMIERVCEILKSLGRLPDKGLIYNFSYQSSAQQIRLRRARSANDEADVARNLR